MIQQKLDGDSSAAKNHALPDIRGMFTAPKTKYKVLMREWKFDIKKLKLNNGYQRMIEYSRIHGIKISMLEDGYWGDEIITVNKNYEVLNGQHRITVAMAIGITHVPIVMLEFPNKEEEVNYFVKKNSWNTKLSPSDFWHARHMAGHPLGSLLYKISEDENSYLYRRIALKGVELDKTNNVIFTAAQALLLISTSVTNSSNSWSFSHDQRLTEMACVNTPYESVIYLTNRMVEFINNILGTDRSKNRFAYKNKPLKAFCQFYIEVIRSGCAKKSEDMLKIMNHMATFPFTAEYARMDRAAQIDSLSSYCNRILTGKAKIQIKGFEHKIHE